GEGYVNRHLVTVEVRVEGGAHQGVQLDGLAFNQHRLERLDTQAVEGGRPVEHYRVFANDYVEDAPHHGLFPLDHFLGGLDGGGQAAAFQLGEDKGLEQLQGHALGQTALVQAQGGADHNHRAAGVVHPLAQQVLAEAALLALDHIRQGFQWALVGAGDGAAAAAVVQQGVDGLLKHALFVAHDDVRGIELRQALQAVVAVDHPAVEVVEVRGGKAATVEGHQGAQVRGQYRQGLHHHPLRLVAGVEEGLQQL